MIEKLQYYFFVYITSAFKFVIGPLAGGNNLNVFEAFIFTVLGMMTTVVVISNFGVQLRGTFFKRFFKKKRLFTKKNRMIVKVWRTYGLFGIAFLTPILFGPIIGSLITVSLGEKRKKIFFNMLFAACFWGFIISYVTVKLGVDVIDFFKQLFS